MMGSDDSRRSASEGRSGQMNREGPVRVNREDSHQAK